MELTALAALGCALVKTVELVNRRTAPASARQCGMETSAKKDKVNNSCRVCQQV